MKTFLLFILLLCHLHASELQRHYIVNHHYVLLSDIIPHVKQDATLFTMKPHKHIMRIKEKKLLTLLHDYGYTHFTSKYSYIYFTQRSPINTQKIKKAIYQLYTKSYKNIKIHTIDVDARSFMKQLPKSYTIHFKRKAPLSQNLIFYIQTPKKRRIFFNAMIKANIQVLIARKNIHKDNPLNSLNTKKKSIILSKFFAMPLQILKKNLYQAKHNLHQGKILTTRDVVSLVYIHRGALVSVTLHNNGIIINFSARALQNGHLHDFIKVKNENGKTIRVRVRGHNIAEVI
jgi:flagella basal body P-ring formation protein FlgA